MNKIQVQLPTPLYARLKELSQRLDYSMAELLRRGAEQIVVFYGHVKGVDSSQEMPCPRSLGLKVRDASKLREFAYQRQ